MNKRTILFAVLILIFFLTIFVSIMFGGSKIEAIEVLKSLFRPGEIDTVSSIIWHIRIPRVILSLFVGMGLALSGCVFQGMLRNPLADPFTLGISGGAAFGAGLCTLLGLSAVSIFFTPLCAFGGTLICISLVYFTSSRKNFSVSSLILSGVILGFLFSSLVLLMFAIADPQQMYSTMIWLMGNLTTTETSLIKITVITVLAGAIVLSFFGRELNILTLGDEKAATLGLETETVKKILFVISSIITAVCVSASGIIGFVGLMIPHLLRRFTGPDHQILLPASALAGASFLALCDTLARTIIAPVELPVGVITGLFGGVFFLVFLFKSHDRIF